MSAKKVYKRGFKTWTEKKAMELRQVLDIRIHEPMPSKLLAEHYKIKIVTPEEFSLDSRTLSSLMLSGSTQWSAVTLGKPAPCLIIHNPTHSIARQESNIMHELAHVICGHEMCSINSELSGSIIPLRKYDETQETEAEWLGACLQLPSKVLYECYVKNKMTELEISSTFNASVEMVRYRINVTGVKKIWSRKAS